MRSWEIKLSQTNLKEHRISRETITGPHYFLMTTFFVNASSCIGLNKRCVTITAFSLFYSLGFCTIDWIKKFSQITFWAKKTIAIIKRLCPMRTRHTLSLKLSNINFSSEDLQIIHILPKYDSRYVNIHY